MTKSILFHPLVLCVVGSNLTTATAAFTQKDSLPRYLGFAASVGLAWFAVSVFHDYIESTGWAVRIVAGALFANPLLLFDRLLVRKWEFSGIYLGPRDAAPAQRAKQTRWGFGTEVAGTVRCTGTALEVDNVPHFKADKPAYVPARSTFLVANACRLVGVYYLNALAVDLQLRADHRFLAQPYVPFFARLADVSRRELLTRIQASLAFWVSQYCVLQFLYSAIGSVGVLFKPGDVALWRPIFGGVDACYTVRGFWGRFWHQNLQLNLKGPADFLTHRVLRLPARGLLPRYSKVFFAFLVSGAMHVVSDAGSVPLRDSGALAFFCAQALGIVLEDAAQALYRRLGGRPGTPLTRLVGYVWFALFLSWSTPAWMYPIVRPMRREEVVFGWAAFRPLLDGLW